MEIFKIHQIKKGKSQIINDKVVNEIPFTINFNNEEIVTLLASPFDLEDLAIGFLFSSGIIKNQNEIKNIIIDKKNWTANIKTIDDLKIGNFIHKRMYTSGCGKGIFFYNPIDISFRDKNLSNLKINTNDINSLIKIFNKKSDIYLKTGGVHSSALAKKIEILTFREDIGRHNAIDKIIGSAILVDYKFKDKIIITSGRISSEIILKIQKCKIPIIISKSAPTDQAIKLAKEFGITLIGFARGNRMNIYSEEKRVNI